MVGGRALISDVAKAKRKGWTSTTSRLSSSTYASGMSLGAAKTGLWDTSVDSRAGGKLEDSIAIQKQKQILRIT